jgi:hypothetical protein
MREHGEGVLRRRCGGRRGCGRGRCGGGADLRLEGLQSCGVCHFGTRDRRIRGSLKRYSLGRQSPAIFHVG